MDAVALAGRILFASMFLASGVNHIQKRRYMSEYAGSQGVPAPMATVVGSGLLLLAGAIMVSFGIWGDLGALFIAAFLVPTSLVMHRFWTLDDPQARQQQQMHFMKNMVMTGGALMTFAWFQCVGANGGYMITQPLFSF